MFHFVKIIQTTLHFSQIHGTGQALSPAELQKTHSAPSLQLWQSVASLSNPEIPGGRTMQNLEPLTLRGDVFNPSILPKTTFKLKHLFFLLKNTLSTLLCRAALWFS